MSYLAYKRGAEPVARSSDGPASRSATSRRAADSELCGVECPGVQVAEDFRGELGPSTK